MICLSIVGSASWKSNFPLSRLLLTKFISTPGKLVFYDIYLSKTSNIKPHTGLLFSKSKLIVTWIPDSSDIYKYKLDQRNRLYTINKSVIFSFNQTKMSWNEGSQLCKDIGGYLPYFTGREQLEEFVGFLKFSTNITPIMRMFIGLKYVSNQLSLNKDFYSKYEMVIDQMQL